MRDLEEERKAAANALSGKGYYAVYCETPEYSYSQHVFSHDSCIDELCKCGGFITLLGKKYGGEYNGNIYREYAEEIKQKSNGRIEKPSITLMEYYVGRKKGLPFLLMLDEAVDEYHSSVERKSRKTLPWKDKSDLDRMAIVVDFINKLNIEDDGDQPKGNMLKYYRNPSDIEITISDFEFGK